MTTINKMITLSKKVLAHDVVGIRGAMGGDNPPLIVSIPREIATAAKLAKGDRMQIFTDGESVYLKKLEDPKI
jgi:hypothetical protein